MKLTASTLNLALCLGLMTTAAVTTTTGCAGNQYNRSTGEYIDDSSLKSRVTDALHDNPDYKFDGVNVDIYRGTVQLSGFVNTDDQKSRAEDIAKGVQGVKKVVNNISLKPQQ
ncbi:MAG TPA: BON domain-containing protein [Verrucomicrobiae bacterium]|jgi:osmotically-inducible protein OsmY